MNLFSKLKNKKILLVDDDEWIRDSLTLYFDTEGCQMIAVETAEEGIELLKQQDYDIILLDYKLPGIDGLTFSREIQEICPDAIKILITAYKNKKIVSTEFSASVMTLPSLRQRVTGLSTVARVCSLISVINDSIDSPCALRMSQPVRSWATGLM